MISEQKIWRSWGVILAAFAGTALGEPSFEVTILPFPEAGDLNNAGQVAGRGADTLYIWENGAITSTIPAVGAYPPHESFQDLSGPRLSENGTLTANVRGLTSTGAFQIIAGSFNGMIATDLGSLPGPTGLTFSPWTHPGKFPEGTLDVELTQGFWMGQ